MIGNLNTLSEFTEKDMSFWGDCDVLRNIWLKKKLNNKQPGSKKISTGVIFMGGGHRAVFLSGFALAVQELKLSSAFDFCLGISTGALAGYYFAGRKPKLGATLLKDSVRQKLIYPKRYKIMDEKKIEDILRNKKTVSLPKIKSSQTKLLIAVTDENGNGRFIDAQKVADPITFIMASLHHPLVTGGTTALVDGQRLVDGSIGNPLPISAAFNFGVTDALVVMTQPLLSPSWDMNGWLVEKIFRRLYFSRLNSRLRRCIHTYSQRYSHELGYFRGEKPVTDGFRLAAIYPKKTVSTFTRDTNLLSQAQKASKKFAKELFLEAK